MPRLSYTRVGCFVGSVFRWVEKASALTSSNIVQSDLLDSDCELYIDDMLSFASSEEELLEWLRRLFERFRKYNITLNPDECEIGLDRVEHVGHLINAEGSRAQS
jgi:hypothetical protein